MKAIYLTLSTALLAAILFAAFISYQARDAEGSVIVGSEYTSTSTFQSYPGNGVRKLKTTYGTLGSFVITGDNTGRVSFYNATTANASLRAARKSTSSILIADFPASTPEGTYTFDVAVSDGIIMVTSGSAATGTVTWR